MVFRLTGDDTQIYLTKDTSILEMENIIKTEGTNYSQFRQESKKTIAAAASTAASIKAVLDTPLLAEDGSLTLESEKLMKNSGI